MKMRAFVISLDHASHRAIRQRQELEMLGMTVIHLDGKRPTDEEKHKSWQTRLTPPSALGCTLAHVAAWERIATSENGPVLILEDDAFPKAETKREFEKDMEGILKLLQGVDAIMLHNDKVGCMRGSTAAYITTPDGAKTLLSVCRNVFGHVDLYMHLQHVKGALKLHYVDNNMFVTDESTTLNAQDSGFASIVDIAIFGGVEGMRAKTVEKPSCRIARMPLIHVANMNLTAGHFAKLIVIIVAISMARKQHVLAVILVLTVLDLFPWECKADSYEKYRS
jgi:GR25 family glycosyltransferase involved in LPS biosynthesis